MSFFFLALFFITKIAGLHVLTHSDDDNHELDCGICDYAITYNLAPVLSPDTQNFAIEKKEFVVRQEVTENYNFISESTITVNQLFSRPPPFIRLA